MYIDSGFDPAAPQQIFDHCLAPFFQKWISPTSLKLDAIRILLERAQAAQCDDGESLVLQLVLFADVALVYCAAVSHVSSTLEPRFDQKTGELISRLTRTSVVAHNNVLGTIESGNPKTAKRLASDLALAYLDQSQSRILPFLASEDVLSSERSELIRPPPQTPDSSRTCATARLAATSLASSPRKRRSA